MWFVVNFTQWHTEKEIINFNFKKAPGIDKNIKEQLVPLVARRIMYSLYLTSTNPDEWKVSIITTTPNQKKYPIKVESHRLIIGNSR